MWILFIAKHNVVFFCLKSMDMPVSKPDPFSLLISLWIMYMIRILNMVIIAQSILVKITSKIIVAMFFVFPILLSTKG